MSYDRPQPPFGTDNQSSGGSSYFSYGSSKSLPVQAGAFNGGLLKPINSTNSFGSKQSYNPISWRPSNPSSTSSSSILPPINPDSNRSATSYSLHQPSSSISSSSLAPVQVSNPIINLNSDSSSRQRSSTQGVASLSTFNPTSYAAPAPPVTNNKFHRTRSSFIPNKWTRGPGDGTFGSVYLSYGGSEFGGRTFGGGPNLSFDRKKPEELWEEEQARKRAANAQNSGNGAPSKKKKSNTRKPKKEKKPPANSKEAQARKLLTRARNQLLAHLSAPSCRLFSEADHVVAVSDDDLDDLLRAGGGDASKVLAHLTEFDRANRKFDSFQELMEGIKEARKAHGDFGVGTEEEPNYEDQTQQQGGDDQQQQQGDDQQQQQQQQVDADGNPIASDDSQNANPDVNTGGESYRSEDYVQEPAAEQSHEEVKTSPKNATAAPSKKSSSKGGAAARGPTIAEKRAAAQAETEAKKRAEEQAKRNAVAKASAARAAEAKKKKAADEEESKESSTAAAKSTPKKAAAAAKPAEEEKKETATASASAASPAKADTTTAAAEESYGDDFDSA